MMGVGASMGGWRVCLWVLHCERKGKARREGVAWVDDDHQLFASSCAVKRSL
jgi:hypothetical protein